MNAFEVTYLGRTKFHQGSDATAMYFRVEHGGRYAGAYAGAVSGPDLIALGSGLSKPFWGALAHATNRAIAARLLGGFRAPGELHETETIWVRPADLKPHLEEQLPLPSEDQVFHRFTLDEDPFPDHDPVHSRILSVGATSISLKAAGTEPMTDS